jgi:hypothetical protein
MVLVAWFSLRDEYRAQTLIKLASNAVFVGNELKFTPVESHKDVERFVQKILLSDASRLKKCKVQAILREQDFLRVVCDGGTEAEVMRNIQIIAQSVIDRQVNLFRTKQSIARDTLENHKKTLNVLEQRIQFMRDVAKGKDELQAVIVLDRLPSLEEKQSTLCAEITRNEFCLEHDNPPGMAPQETRLVDRSLQGYSWLLLVGAAFFCGLVTVVSLGVGSVLREQLRNNQYAQR